jgi:Gpi18-like mannosyltransferase
MSIVRALTHNRPLEKPAAYTVAILAVISIAALFVRLPFRDFVTSDYTWFLGSWYRVLQENGGLLALRLPVSNYTPPYLYLMILANALLPFAYPLHAIKVISIIFDFVCAFGALSIIKTLMHSDRMALVGYAAVLFCPTVIANGALWGQVDAIFTAFLVLSIWRLTKHDRLGALFFYGLSLAYKFQAVFLLPLFLFLILDGFFRWQDMLIIPSVYLAVNVPAILVGRSPIDTLTIYYGQVGQFDGLTMHGPSIYQWLPAEPAKLLSIAGLAAAALFVLGIFIFLRRSGTPVMTQLLPVSMALLIGIPFLLPFMHERYFFPADVLSVVIACVDRRLRWLPFPVVAGSGLAYAGALGFLHGVSLAYASALMFIALVALLIVMIITAKANKMHSPSTSVQYDAAHLPKSRFVYAFAGVSIVAYCLAIPVGEKMASLFDKATIAARLSYNGVSTVVRSPIATRCNDRVRVDVTWTDTSDARLIQGAHMFVHGLDGTQSLVAQADGPMPMDILMARPVLDRRDLITPNPSNISQVQVGLYQLDNMQRYQALKIDDTAWIEDAVVIPVKDGTCNW